MADKLELNAYQTRRILDLSHEASEYAKALGVDNLFTPIASDGQTVLAPGSNYKGNETVYTEAMDIVKDRLEVVIGKKNPLAEEAKNTIAVLAWNTPGVWRYRKDKPHFSLKNKTHSPIYLNCREFIKYPQAMHLIAAFAQSEYESTCPDADVFTGGELAGVYFATWFANNFN